LHLHDTIRPVLSLEGVMQPAPAKPISDEEEIFQVALGLSDVTRGAFLERVCAEDENLRSRVDQLIASHEASGFMDATDAGNGFFQREGKGDRVGPFKLVQIIGEGGFGTVWMAEQEQPVRRSVALKIIKFGMDTREVVARFEQERQALAMMEHPNIAQVYDAGATPGGRPYFAM
jgi:eukaryotic-like serine/threonine-protein kinase